MSHPIQAVTVSAKRKAAGGKKTVSGMNIDCADNGFTTQTHFQSSTDDEGRGQYHESEKHVHETAEGMVDHVRKTFGAKSGKS
jgi:hypothetical protein